jgi:hypothetical protein
MTSILLGPLAQNNKLKNIYNSDMENKIKKIELKQATQNFNKPEYLNQFDELRFDSISGPVGINQAHTNNIGLDTTLQRNLDFQNGYSNFQKNDMHYDVIAKNKFTHNNMIPNTSRRDFSVNADRTQRKLETFTGNFDNYTPKKEKVPLFEPVADLTWVNGVPAISNKLQNRFLPSNKNNNGNLPFENNVWVKPGLGDKNQQGNYAVYRINPRDIDTLRSDINQKITYDNKPLEVLKKGELRGPDFNLTKYKLPDFREQSFGDLIGSRAVKEGAKQTGKFTDIKTQRNETQIYIPGHAVNTTMGEGPDKKKTRFEPSKNENYMNDPTHAIVGVNVKPVMTNKQSYTNYETQRVSTNIQYEAPLSKTDNGSYVIDYKDVPLTTLRQLMIHGETNIGVSGGQEKNAYVFSNDYILPITNRQTQSTNNPILGPTSEVKLVKTFDPTDKAKATLRPETSHNLAINTISLEKNVPVYNQDQAKPTIKQATSHNLAINTVSLEKNVPVYNQDQAKPTIKQATSHNLAINTVSLEKNVPVYNEDQAKPTIKQTTLLSSRPNGNPSLALANYARDINDQAKITTRQQTENTQYIGSVGSNAIEATYARDVKEEAKPTIRQQTENTQYIGSVNSNAIEATYVRDISDEAKPTIKQTTLFATPGGRMGDVNQGNYARDINDKAKTTIKQTTMLRDYIGGLKGEVDAHISHIASDNMTIDERREITTYNRATNGKKDLNGPYIDEDNVRFNDKRTLYSYVSHPHKNLDHTVMPTTTRQTIETVYSMSKPVVETSSYYVNPYFINTLKNNPLVNDIYHQKNV